jgi:hypothetical protein
MVKRLLAVLADVKPFPQLIQSLIGIRIRHPHDMGVPRRKTNLVTARRCSESPGLEEEGVFECLLEYETSLPAIAALGSSRPTHSRPRLRWRILARSLRRITLFSGAELHDTFSYRGQLFTNLLTAK